MQEQFLVELVGISFIEISRNKEKPDINMKQRYFKQSWTVGSVIKSTSGSLKRPRFYSKSPPEDSPWFQVPCMHVAHRLHARKTHKHKIVKVNLRNYFKRDIK